VNGGAGGPCRPGCVPPSQDLQESRLLWQRAFLEPVAASRVPGTCISESASHRVWGVFVQDWNSEPWILSLELGSVGAMT
jgi:hypothetical protein